MLKRIHILVICIAAFSFKSCQTDFSVNGNYEITPVVMGLLDHGDSIHIIKITKAFLGDGNNLVYAKESDSNYFKTVTGFVQEYDVDGILTGNQWTLYDSLIPNKDTGVFYAPEQKVYYFTSADLKENYEYELIVKINEGMSNEDSLDARTSMIRGFIIGSSALVSNKINFNGATVNSDDDYKPYKFFVTEAYNAKLYNYKYIFKWTEHYTDGSTQKFEAERNNIDVIQESYTVANGHYVYYHGLDFFRWLGGYTNTGGQQISGLISYDATVDKRTVDGIDIRISIAHYNLDQFMEITAPQTGIAQSQPEFTNVNRGLGLFSSRHIFELENYRLSQNSMKELCKGAYTALLQFCSEFPEDVGESYYCP
ncbi:hypothetical protein JYT72_02010 [Crocinitomix catalasitica]|nr:hypothetical protein [Crocinitomix catalasitica]